MGSGIRFRPSLLPLFVPAQRCSERLRGFREVGLSVVDLGLVYRAARGDAGIEVDLTLTTRACPLGGMIVEDARERLSRRFQDVRAVGPACMRHGATPPCLGQRTRPGCRH
jgi:hypothetical protein